MDALVLGIDTKSRSFHFVANQLIPTVIPTIAKPFGFVASEHENVDLARAELFNEAHRLFRGIPYGSHVFCEEPLALAKNPRTTRILCMVGGAIYAAFVAAKRDAMWHWVDPASWKKAVLGRGAPPKGLKHKPWIEETLLADPAFVAWLHADLRRRGEFMVEPDLYDAWCLMTYGVGVLNSLPMEGH